ncbi:MAG: hypothetical protein RLZZ458_1625, partial [Planctomycetota bacterium]
FQWTQQFQFGGVFADDADVAVVMFEHLSAEVAEATVTEYDGGAAGDGQLLWNSTGCSNRFNEDRGGIGDLRRYGVQVDFRNEHGFGEGAVVIEDADDGASWAVGGKATAAEAADVTGAVDFPDDSLAGIAARARDADEFVAEDTAETHVALTKLQVGFANAGFEHVDGDFAGQRRTQLSRRSEVQLAVKNHSTHAEDSGNTAGRG